MKAEGPRAPTVKEGGPPTVKEGGPRSPAKKEGGPADEGLVKLKEEGCPKIEEDDPLVSEDL